MKFNEYIGLWLIAFVALFVIVTFSLADGVQIKDYELKKAPIREALLRHPSSFNAIDEAPPADTLALAQSMEVKVDSLPQNILIFGDSMTFNLALRLAQYSYFNGHKINTLNWDSSNTKIWAEHDSLAYYINKFHPSFIFISLGSNEVYFKNPEVRRPYVEKILSTIGEVPYVWIGPPNWNKDTGINAMLAAVCRKGSFFLSEGIPLKRKQDKIHPTREASALWVDSLMRWLPKSSHPFVAEVPPDSLGGCNPHVVFMKALNK